MAITIVMVSQNVVWFCSPLRGDTWGDNDIIHGRVGSEREIRLLKPMLKFSVIIVILSIIILTTINIVLR